MKKSFILLSLTPLALTSIASCSNGGGNKISLYDSDSHFVLQSFEDRYALPLQTYRNSATGEVPYVELGQFFYVNGGLGNKRTTVSKEDNAYLVKDEAGHRLCAIDPSRDVLTVENYHLWGGMMPSNNGVGPDLAAPGDQELGAVIVSPSSKYHGQLKPEVYDLTPYGFDCVEQDGKCYVPIQLLSNIYYRWNATDILYNGYDFYFSPFVSSGSVPVIAQSFYANKGRFAALEGVDAVEAKPLKGESYRYAYPVKEGDKTVYRIISLTSDGKGALREGSSPEDEGKAVPINGVTYAYKWNKKGEAIYVETIATGVDAETGKEETVSQGVSKIPLREGFYATKRRPEAIARFSYDLLRFQFDHFYGIKDVAGFTDFDAFASSKGVKEGLLSLDADAYDDALAKTMMTVIDDCHTGYTLPSIFSGKFVTDGDALFKKHEGPRYKTLIQKRAEYLDLRSKALGIVDKKDQPNGQGLFVQGSTAVLRFDGFASQGMFLSGDRSKGEVEETDPLSAIKAGDTALAFDCAFNRIAKNKDIKNVVIDLTCNGGGSVMALPYVLAHFTADPTMYFLDKAMGVAKEFHYQVDLNHDKKFGQKEDTYQGQYKFFVLTSSFSFSCANFLPLLAKLSNVKVIGEKSGGGACSVAAYTDGSGSVYNLSSPQVCVAPEGKGFRHYDAGVPVDYELPSSSWYDLSKLDAFLGGLAK